MRFPMLDNPKNAELIIKDHQRNIRNMVNNERLSQQMLSRKQKQSANIRIAGIWVFVGAGSWIFAKMVLLQM